MFFARAAMVTGRFLERFQVNRFASGAVADGRREHQVEAAFRYFKWKKLLNLWRVEWQLRTGKTDVTAFPYGKESDLAILRTASIARHCSSLEALT